MKKVVVIGAGQAGFSLVAKLRTQGFDGAITMLGAEPTPPYQRPPLSKKYLLGEMDLERLFLRPETYYQEADIDLRLGTRATRVDTEAKTVFTTSDTGSKTGSNTGNDSFAYDDLVFATGSSPRRLPAAIGGDLDGVYTVRDLRDADAMAPAFRKDARVLIVGGGYIGLEAAAVAASKGLCVTVVEMADRILQRVAAPETSDYFRALHLSHGVDIREGIGLKHLSGDTHVRSATLSDGRVLEVDFVVIGVGISPETDLAAAAGIAVENGITTNALGQTSVPNVWAAGDCASLPYRGGQIRLESVPNAIDQAEVIAQNILGADLAYHAKPWFWSDQYDVKLQIAGLNTGYTQVVTRAGDKEGAMSFWYYADTTLLAVDAANDPRAYMVGKRLIEAGKSPDPAHLQDPETDLKALLKS